jgi:catechol 2,3-dioxygenase-like protein
MQALVTHLHALATEVALGEDEWRALIDALTATGQISDERLMRIAASRPS